ncbi:PREDICTED: butyrophilin-like protein 2 isoform X2 [Chinchilla lanigera]|uniref:Butyrophilin-like protein 2 n=2 Tax=Chinchilla lanigera TaxID=34839 RepID=A0A8C2VBJ5_CHILA|nr:PREDICTED: butyrophilin-like protein 2 isoform X2 [Chinchilla lanigera]XP_005389504.1 PREDICTED: butyrophilin-like protein 2 isoform X2 [Chinchilla lanigera]
MVEFPGYSLSGVIASYLFILLTMKPQDDLRVLGPAGPILAKVGEDALLTCQLLPKRSAAHMEVQWFRSEPRPAETAHQDGTEMVEVQMEKCRGRLEMIEDSVAEGSVTLKIHSVQPSDSGQYWCRFQDGDYLGEASLLLQVAGLGSAPNLHVTRNDEGRVQLVCTAEGWFPEPHVYWEDRWGEKLLTVSEHHIPDDSGLFYVEDTLVVGDVSAATETVSCFIHNPVLKDGKRAVLSLPEKLQTEMASLKLIGPSQPILVRVGEDTQLTCYLSPKTNAQSMEVRWVRSLRYPAVHVYVDGDHVAGEQMSEYRGRTSLVSDAIHEGRSTLQIHDTRASDDGQYWCLFEKDGVYQEASLDLKVVAVGSAPLITVEEQKDGAKQLTCTSYGWFPHPRVQWRDTEGTMPSSPAALRQGGRGLFHVESLLLVTNSSVVNVTCSIINLPLGEEKTTAVVLSEFKMSFSWKMLLLAVIIGLIWMKSYKKVNVTQDSNTAPLKPTLAGEHRNMTCEHSYNQMSHRMLTTTSTPWARRGSRQPRGIESLRTGMREYGP